MPDVNSYNYQEIHDKKLAESICVAAVVQVTEFDEAKMTVNVQPLSKHLENGQYESQPPILKVPIACTHCAGFIFRPWYKKGDVGVVVFLDHDMDSAVSGGKESEPLTERNHSMTDAIFIGGIVAGDYSAQGMPSKSILLAADDGSKYVSVQQDKITLANDKGSTYVTVASGEIQMKGKVKIIGDVEVTGSVKATGDVVASSSISLTSHTHPGCRGGSTGAPA